MPSYQATSRSFVRRGRKQGLLSVSLQAARYWVERPGARSCPVGGEIESADECKQAYEQVKLSFRLPNVRGIVSGSFVGVPRGCSIQANGVIDDQTPHYNSNQNSDGGRAVLGSALAGPLKDVGAEFIPICKAPTFWKTAGGKECPAGTRINGQLACKAAYDTLRNSFAAPAKRLLVTGSWEHVPPGCTAAIVGEDSTPHMNSFADARGQGNWASLCWPGRYYLAPLDSRKCPTNQQITTVEECRAAYRSLVPQLDAAGFQVANSRGVVPGRFGTIPPFCTAQTSVAGAGFDGAPHFNCNSLSLGELGATNAYRPLCKILVPNVDPAPPSGDPAGC